MPKSSVRSPSVEYETADRATLVRRALEDSLSSANCPDRTRTFLEAIKPQSTRSKVRCPYSSDAKKEKKERNALASQRNRENKAEYDARLDIACSVLDDEIRRLESQLAGVDLQAEVDSIDIDQAANWVDFFWPVLQSPVTSSDSELESSSLEDEACALSSPSTSTDASDPSQPAVESNAQFEDYLSQFLRVPAPVTKSAVLTQLWWLQVLVFLGMSGHVPSSQALKTTSTGFSSIASKLPRISPQAAAMLTELRRKLGTVKQPLDPSLLRFASGVIPPTHQFWNNPSSALPAQIAV